MAKIETNRPEALHYNGREVRFVRDVTAADGPAFDKNVDQVIVKIEEVEVYFFANEVTLTDDERETADRQRDEAHETAADAKDAEQRNTEGKKKLLAGHKRDAGDSREAKQSGSGQTMAPGGPDRRLQQSGSANPQNRIPGQPPERPQGVGAPMSGNTAPQPTVTRPGVHPVEQPLPHGAQPMSGAPSPQPVDQPEPAEPADNRGQ